MEGCGLCRSYFLKLPISTEVSVSRIYTISVVLATCPTNTLLDSELGTFLDTMKTLNQIYIFYLKKSFVNVMFI